MRCSLQKYFTLFILVLSLAVRSQTYPAKVITTLMPPASIYLNDYTDPFHPLIKANVTFFDFTEPQWQVSLRLKIQGQGITLQTLPGFKPAVPVTVTPGIPYEISGADLAPYFNYNNLSFSGISRQQLETNNRLPEGLYSFCFEVLDYETGKVISLQSCASAWLSLNDPPIIIAPACGSVVQNISSQNILFNWQISNTNGNLDLTNLGYQLNLYEVTQPGVNPATAILNNQALPIWQSTIINQNSLVYGLTEPPLETGKQYVFNVQAIESNPQSQIKNNGYSQTCSFHFGYPEGGHIDLLQPVNNKQLSLSDNGTFEWKRPDNALTGQMVQYEFKMVELLSGQDPANAIINNQAFYTYTVTASTASQKMIGLPQNKLNQIKRMTPYAWKVIGKSGQQTVAESDVFIFTGPPTLEKFYAGGFEITVTQLSVFDSISGKCTGRGKTFLKPGGAEAPEFAFSDIYLASIGNNRWIMNSGTIADAVNLSDYIVDPNNVDENKSASFSPDSIFINKYVLKLSGNISWKLPHPVQSSTIPKIRSKKTRLLLSNGSYVLNSENPVSLEQNYSFNLLEPFSFRLHISPNSKFTVTQNEFELDLNGLIQLPSAVADGINSTVLLPYSNQKQLFYISEFGRTDAEAIRLIQNTGFELLPVTYVMDLSEKQSPGELAADSLWKGVYINGAALIVPKITEQTGQITVPQNLSLAITNSIDDSTIAYVDYKGLRFKCDIPFLQSDSLKFNTFSSSAANLSIDINESTLTAAALKGLIHIPVIDSARVFPYTVPLSSNGFQEGYLNNGLAGTQFIFNASGSIEQKVNITITRAVFKSHNRIEMDLDLTWPHFNLSLNGVQRLCAWGNNNIGFEIPNGSTALTYQAAGKSGGYDIAVDKIGCGRTKNIYALGVSAKINMSEDISGDLGAPIVNAYSMYKNKLLGEDFIYQTTDSASLLNHTASSGADSTSDYNSQTDSYQEALNNDLNESLGGLGIDTRDTASYGDDNSGGNVLLSQNTYLELQKMIEVAERLMSFIEDERLQKAKDYVTVFKQVINSDAVKRTVNVSGKEFLNNLLENVLESCIKKLTQPIENAGNKAEQKIRTAINNYAVNPVNHHIDSLLGLIFKKIDDNVTSGLDESIKPAVKVTLNTIKNNLSAEIKQSVSTSVENNVTKKITGFLREGITVKITGFIRSEVQTAGTELINNRVNANINLNNTLQNAGALFESIGDTIADAVKSLSLSNIKNTVISLGDDAISGIDWDNITTRILNDLVSQGIKQGIVESIKGALGDNAEGIAAGILSTVKFDFSNLGEKLQNGQLDQIVKFDPTNICIITNPCDIKGQLKFTKDDPTYGDSWQATVFVKLKTPDKNNRKEFTAFFLNGYTTNQPQNFGFWFAKLGAKGLGWPLGSTPITLDGIDGLAYHHMQKTGNSTAIPNINNKYGVGARFYMYDTPGKGKLIIFDVGLDVIINNGSFAVELSGTANVGNIVSSSNPGVSSVPSIATATGLIGYYSDQKKVSGNFNVVFNTAPLYCAGGDMGLNIDGLNNTWEVYIGRKASPIYSKTLCKDWLSTQAYFEVSKTKISAGLKLSVDVQAKTPWVDFGSIKARGFAGFGFGFEANADITIEPSFKINEAYLHAWANAGIGFEYETSVNSGSVTIAGVSLEGDLLYKSNPNAEVHGGMSGSVTLLGFDIGVNMELHYDLNNRQMLN